MDNSFAITTTFIIYLILMLAIGVFAYQRTKNSSDYFLGAVPLGHGLLRCQREHRI